MEIITAKSAGFCFGVERAVNTVYECLAQNQSVVTLGPIIHNPQLVAEFAERGVGIIDQIAQCPPDKRVIVRAHGVPRSVLEELGQRGIPFTDATCPFVAKIHRIVEKADDDTLVIIAGDARHPEVLGIIGHVRHAYVVIAGPEGLAELGNQQKYSKKHYIMVAQTTFNMVEWEKCIVTAKKLYTNLQIFDTICNATAVRQQEAAELAQSTDLMIVVGGRHSSNTEKLAQICRQYTPTVLIETAEELTSVCLEGVNKVGITAGASTPVCIIKEVQETMDEMMNGIQEELSFEEMLNQSFKSTYNGEKVTAVVTSIAPNEITVDIGTKHAGYVPLHELTDDPTAKCEDIVSKGDSIELLVVRVNDVEGTVMLSKKRLDAAAGFEKVMYGVDSGEIFEGVVTDVIKGGVLALTNGVKVFIPASHATMSRNEDLTTLLRKKISFKILEANRQRRRAVGSVREVLKEARRAAEEKFWAVAEVGTIYNGIVKSMTDYGAFIDLGGIDGMVHISELSWNKLRHPSQVLKIGDQVEVYIKDLDHEKKKISLGYKKASENPWEILKNTYAQGDVAKVKIVSLTAFGAFAELLPGIDGLIHISQISLDRINKPADVLSVGDEVDVQITEIDYDKKRISLSIKALLDHNSEEFEESAQ